MHRIALPVLICCLMSACATTPEARIGKDPAAFSSLTPQQQERVRQGGVGIGFEASAVRLALGEPDRVLERETEEGLTEVWVYYVVLPTFYAPNCGAGFPYYGRAYQCQPLSANQYEERTRVSFKDGKVVLVERAK